MLLGRFGNMNKRNFWKNKRNFWKNKRVLVTGHTGFKGSWLSFWLNEMGAKVIGYSLEPETNPSLFNVLELEDDIISIYGDIRDRNKLDKTIKEFKPDIIFHLAAQAIVSTSYLNPIETFEINIIGTANLFDLVRNTDFVKVVINVTSDKCYENKEQLWGYREVDPMGGYDPYSCSKGCSELITNSFRNSFFKKNNIMLASVRAGNVIGGGDWSDNRLLPDIIRGLNINKAIEIRNPYAIRPWQHVLEPISGYLALAQKLWDRDNEFAEGWNFGPEESNVMNVQELTNKVILSWNDKTIENEKYYFDNSLKIYEAQILKLDSSKAKYKLGWKPKLDIKKTIDWTTGWYKRYYSQGNMKQFTLEQIKKYEQMGLEDYER